MRQRFNVNRWRLFIDSLLCVDFENNVQTGRGRAVAKPSWSSNVETIRETTIVFVLFSKSVRTISGESIFSCLETTARVVFLRPKYVSTRLIPNVGITTITRHTERRQVVGPAVAVRRKHRVYTINTRITRRNIERSKNSDRTCFIINVGRVMISQQKSWPKSNRKKLINK